MKPILILCAALGLSVAPAATQAATYKLDYTTFADTLFPSISLDATLVTGAGEYPGDPGVQITSISGTRDGVAISSLADPFSEVYPDQTPIVDEFGITFTAGDYTYEFYNDGSSDGVSYHEFATLTSAPDAPGQGRLIADEAVSLTPVSAAPEPSVWALLMSAVAVSGGALRRAGRRSAVAA